MPYEFAKSQMDGTVLAEKLASQIEGKTILITGVSANSIGAAYVVAIAPYNPALIIMSGRSEEKLAATITEAKAANPDVKIKTLLMDLKSLKQVRAAAATVNGWDDVPHIDVLVLNAGIMAFPEEKTEDGLELHFQVNYLAHFLFTNLIMDKVLAAANPRIISVASVAHILSHVRWYDLQFEIDNSYNKWHAYGQSKTANMLFARGLAKRFGDKNLLAVSLHPGCITSNLAGHLEEHQGFCDILKERGSRYYPFNFPWLDTNKGAANHVYASFSPEITPEINGIYIDEFQPADQMEGEIMPWANNDVEAEMLWKKSEEILGEQFLA